MNCSKRMVWTRVPSLVRTISSNSVHHFWSRWITKLAFITTINVASIKMTTEEHHYKVCIAPGWDTREKRCTFQLVLMMRFNRRFTFSRRVRICTKITIKTFTHFFMRGNKYFERFSDQQRLQWTGYRLYLFLNSNIESLRGCTTVT